MTLVLLYWPESVAVSGTRDITTQLGCFTCCSTYKLKQYLSWECATAHPRFQQGHQIVPSGAWGPPGLWLWWWREGPPWALRGPGQGQGPAAAATLKEHVSTKYTF